MNGNEGKLCNACGIELSDQQKEAFLKAEKQRGAQSVKELEEVKNKIAESEKELKDITNSIGDKNVDDLYTKIAELRQKLNADSNTFHFDKEGHMINGDGYRVFGFQPDEKGKMTNKVDFIKLGNTTIPAAATQEVKMSMNLDSR